MIFDKSTNKIKQNYIKDKKIKDTFREKHSA